MNFFTLVLGLALFAWFAAPTHAKDSKEEAHYVFLDCDHKSLSNEWTGNIVKVEFWQNGVKMGETSSNMKDESWSFSPYGPIPETHENAWVDGPPQCKGAFNTQYYFSGHMDGKDHESNPTHVILRIDGENAFFIDKLSYKDQENSRNDRDFGNDNNGGWCLSTDPTDADRSWKAYVEGCHSALKFHLADGRVTTTTDQ